MQGGPVDELLDVAVERPALDQLEVEVGHTLEDWVPSGLTGDHGEERRVGKECSRTLAICSGSQGENRGADP